MPITRIVSGGQTGVDRGALDAAIAMGIEHGGWCPRGRLAEDGRIPERYELTENESREYWIRTAQNVVDSDGTLILYRGTLSGGTELTHRMAIKEGRPHLLVDLLAHCDPQLARQWIVDSGIAVLNVAGPRESSAPGIAAEARSYVEGILAEVC